MDRAEAETLRGSGNVAFSPAPPAAVRCGLARHLRVAPRSARAILRRLADGGRLAVASGKLRYRTCVLPTNDDPSAETNLIQ